MKNILMVSQHYPPEIGAASNRSAHIVSHLLKNGYHIDLITSKPNYPNPVIYQSLAYEEMEHERLNIYRCPVLPGSFPLLSRLLNQLFFLFFALWTALLICLRQSINKCVTTSPPFAVNVIGMFVSKVLRIPWVMEVRDLWPDSMIAVGAIRESHPLYKLFKRLEHAFYRCSRHIVVVTYHTRELLIQQGIPPNKMTVITNGVPDWITSVDQADQQPKQTMKVMYIGNLGLSQNLGIVLDAANRLKAHEQIEFYFIGEGLDKEQLIRKARQLQLSNVHFIDGVTDKRQLAQWYLQADLGIVSLKKAQLFKSVIPSKVFEYAGLNVPIMLIGDGEVAEMIERYELGFSVDVDISKVSEAILGFYQRWKETDQNHVTNPHRDRFKHDFSWEHLIQKYIQVLNA